MSNDEIQHERWERLQLIRAQKSTLKHWVSPYEVCRNGRTYYVEGHYAKTPLSVKEKHYVLYGD